MRTEVKRNIGTQRCFVLIVMISLGFSFILSPVKKSKEKKVKINIHHLVGNTALVLDSLKYKNAFGQDFSITKFKYYIGNIVLKRTDGTYFAFNDYFLVNEEDNSSKTLILDHVPATHYSSIEFIIGVDSLHNCSGAQSGALDPVNAMFWAWNSGYIFLKLEGMSPVSKLPGHIFEYHIGGYKQPANCIRKVKLPLHNFSVGGQKSDSQIDLRVDLLQFFDGPEKIDLEKMSSVTDFRNSTLVANNYMDMFSIADSANEN